jgi:tRNA pseudouridine32 synthase/23S rRNA pseudouridine746 synthase
MEVPVAKVGHDKALPAGRRALPDPNLPATTSASRLQLPQGEFDSVLEGVCAHFPRISRVQWQDRFARGRVLDAGGTPLPADAPYRVGDTILYFREVPHEPRIPFEERILHADEHLVVADKPHFLPVVPAGRYVRETLLARLVERTGNPNLAPLHRIDRGTAGLVMFSAEPRSRAVYQALFREHTIEKRYEAIAPGLPGLAFPLLRESRIVKAEPFFRMAEVSGPANARTRIEVLEAAGPWWRYALYPVTGRKHQLRVHMAGLGAPIRNDAYYPEAAAEAADDPARPLQLLARGLGFRDPLDGSWRHFESDRRLQL